MSNLTSEYEINLVLNDDKTRDSIQSLKKSLNNISSGMSFEDAKKEVERLGNTLNSVAKDTSESSTKIINQFSRDSKKAVQNLESQYVNLKVRDAPFLTYRLPHTLAMLARIRLNRSQRLPVRLRNSDF